MNSLLAIDPGQTKSGVCAVSDWTLPRPVAITGEWDNDFLLNRIAQYELVVIERCANYGCEVGQELFDTILWAGRFVQARLAAGCSFPILIDRPTIKLRLLGKRNGKDSQLRAALIDRYGPSKEQAVGTKKNPGPLYGVSGSHEWAALAVAVAYQIGE